MAKRSIPIEEKIEAQKEQVSKAKDRYEAELDKLEKLIGIVNNGLVNPCENNIQQAALNCSKYIRR